MVPRRALRLRGERNQELACVQRKKSVGSFRHIDASEPSFSGSKGKVALGRELAVASSTGVL
jgi:hypothetical protein